MRGMERMPGTGGTGGTGDAAGTAGGLRRSRNRADRSPQPLPLTALPLTALVLPATSALLLAGTLLAAVAFDQGALAQLVSDAMGSSGGVFHELFHDARHLLGVPCH